MKLNLGCGEKLKKGYINCDKHQENADMKFDLNELPLPFDNDSVEEIILCQTLEHIDNQYELLLDCHRILKKGGILKVMLPSFNCNVQHKTFYHSLVYLDDIFVYKEWKKDRTSEQQIFEIVNFKRRKSILHPYVALHQLKRLWSWINSVLFVEYYWELRNK